MSPNPAIQRQKARLRQQFLSRRDELSRAQAQRASQAICQRLAQMSALEGVARLAGYAARGGEASVRPYLKALQARGREVVLPRVLGAGQMQFCVVRDWTDLVTGAFGIAEPTGGPVDLASIDAFLVPGVAFGHQGGRIGFGMGFYDRALPAVGQALAIGVCHDWQLVAHGVPTEPHDRPMDWLVSDRQLLAVTSSPTAKGQ